MKVPLQFAARGGSPQDRQPCSGCHRLHPNQELRRRARGTRVVTPLLLGQGCVPSKLYSSTDSARGFGHTANLPALPFPLPTEKKIPSFPSWELLLTAVVCLWCFALLHMCKVLVVWNAYADSVVGQLRALTNFNSQIKGKKPSISRVLSVCCSN